MLSVALSASAANYYLRLGLWGLDDRHAKLLLLSIFGLTILYGAFLIPTRREYQEYRDAKRIGKDE